MDTSLCPVWQQECSVWQNLRYFLLFKVSMTRQVGMAEFGFTWNLLEFWWYNAIFSWILFCAIISANTFLLCKPFLPNRYAIFDSLQWRADTDWEQMNFALGCHAKFTHTFLLAMVIFLDIKLFILYFFWIFAPKFAFKSMSKKCNHFDLQSLKINPKTLFRQNIKLTPQKAYKSPFKCFQPAF